VAPDFALRIVPSQAFRIVIPPNGNDFIALIEDTSLVTVITAEDVLRGGGAPAARLSQRSVSCVSRCMLQEWRTGVTKVAGFAAERRKSPMRAGAARGRAPRLPWRPQERMGT
jgi:ABC-type arginine transport system permease subunit